MRRSRFVLLALLTLLPVMACTKGDECDVCTTDEECACNDCRDDARCAAPASCVDDGFCWLYTEGCDCADCASTCLAENRSSWKCGCERKAATTTGFAPAAARSERATHSAPV